MNKDVLIGQDTQSRAMLQLFMLIDYKDLTSIVIFFSKGRMFIESNTKQQKVTPWVQNTKHFTEWGTVELLTHLRKTKRVTTIYLIFCCLTWAFSAQHWVCVVFFLSRIKEGRGSHRTALSFQRCHENVTLTNCGNKTHPGERALRIFTRKTETKTACDSSYIARKIVQTFKSHVEMHKSVLQYGAPQMVLIPSPVLGTSHPNVSGHQILHPETSCGPLS